MINDKLLAEMLGKFAAERDWDQFHTPKNIATSIAVEAAELLELFQWTRGEKDWASLSLDVDLPLKTRIEEELADILLYLIRFADKADIDLEAACRMKLDKNSIKYPVAQFKGSDRKYNE